MNGTLKHITLDSGKDPRHSIIWLHGLGANGEDFVPIVDEMHLHKSVRYLFPHAPKRPVTINGGFVMPAWYDIRGTDFGASQDAQGICAAQIEIEKLIGQEIQRGIKPENIFLAGFSQGGVIALHTGLRFKERLGGIVALSTYLALADSLADQATQPASSTPIFMAHGHHDPVVPFTIGKSSAEILLRSGYTLEWHEYPMQHTVCMEEIKAIEDWLNAKLAG